MLNEYSYENEIIKTERLSNFKDANMMKNNYLALLNKICGDAPKSPTQISKSLHSAIKLQSSN